MRPDHSKLGANVGFGYLTDDDDDDATGGTGGDTFDALVFLPATQSFDYGDTGDYVQLSITVTAVGAQNNGSFWVAIGDSYGTNVINGVLTTALDGWTQTGWSLASGTWTNHFTKSSVAAGTYNLTANIYLGLNSGWVYADTYTPTTPVTDEAAGGGNLAACHVIGGP